MTFLNPALLLGLAAAAIPVILHLLNLRKLKTVEFSTLNFLRELRTTITRLKPNGIASLRRTAKWTFLDSKQLAIEYYPARNSSCQKFVPIGL